MIPSGVEIYVALESIDAGSTSPRLCGYPPNTSSRALWNA